MKRDVIIRTKSTFELKISMVSASVGLAIDQTPGCFHMLVHDLSRKVN